MKTVTFRRFYARLKAGGYADMEIAHLYRRIRDLDADIQGWVADWVADKGYPEDRIEGMTVRELTERLNMKPMNAFITMNWLRNNPEEAKYSLLSMYGNGDLEISEEMREAARKCLRELGEEDEEQKDSDFSDITVETQE